MDRNMPSILFATPCYGGQVFMNFVNSWTSTIPLLMREKWNASLLTLGNESLITRARNVLLARFMNTDFTHIMFIDADIGWEPENIIEMVKADKDVIGGVYPKKAIMWDYLKSPSIRSMINNLPDDASYDKEISPLMVDYVVRGIKDKNKIEKVNYVGTGFLLIKRHVIEKLITAYPETKFRYDRNHKSSEEKWLFALFDTKLQDGEYLSEDYVFCQRWQDIGGEVWAYTPAKLNHTGNHVYNGEFNKKLSYIF